MLKIIFSIRAWINRKLFPASRYKLAPISSKFGFDRGTPIDRYWIEKFLTKNNTYIQGEVLEVTDSAYTARFGKDRVTSSDVLDIDPKNKKANIRGDLRHLSSISDNAYDCVILTHVLGLIDDVQAAASECYRILKPGGVLLFTSSCLGAVLGEQVYWRFTANSIGFLFGRYFNSNQMQIKTFGNALAGQCFWVGMSQEDLNSGDLDFNDPRFPCIVTMRAIK